MNINEQINQIEEASMQLFADGNNEFRINDWISWEMACLDQERMIPPEEFKNYSVSKKRSFMKHSLRIGYA